MIYTISISYISPNKDKFKLQYQNNDYDSISKVAYILCIEIDYGEKIITEKIVVK